jgi:hypothetical protein
MVDACWGAHNCGNVATKRLIYLIRFDGVACVIRGSDQTKVNPYGGSGCKNEADGISFTHACCLASVLPWSSPFPVFLVALSNTERGDPSDQRQW